MHFVILKCYLEIDSYEYLKFSCVFIIQTSLTASYLYNLWFHGMEKAEDSAEERPKGVLATLAIASNDDRNRIYLYRL